MNLCGAQGVHPGNIAITFDSFDYLNIFGDKEEEAVVEEINAEMLTKYEYSDNSILYTHKKTTDCDCKFFFGHYSKLKGLTVKALIFITVHGMQGDQYNLSGFNRVACYLALSRSSCVCIVFNVRINDMSMKQYQTDKMNFDKEKLQDEGYERRTNYTYCGEIWDKSKNYPEVCYIQPDGTSDSVATTTFPLHDILGNATIVSTSKRFLGKETNEKSEEKRAPCPFPFHML